MKRLLSGLALALGLSAVLFATDTSYYASRVPVTLDTNGGIVVTERLMSTPASTNTFARTIVKLDANGSLVVAVNNVQALTHATPANQTGNATATFKMNGLGAAAAPCTITPTQTGRVEFTITGQLVQNTTGDGVTYKLAFGTGTAPANAAAASGTVISATPVWTALTGQLTSQFAVTSIATGLTLNTAVWYDLQVADVTGGTAAITNVDCTAAER
jgi:hypothetical protein